MALPTEAVSITVQSSIGEDGPLTVQDGLRQVIDFFDLLSLAHGGGEEIAISWHLVSISKASPLTAVGLPVPAVFGVAIETAARLARERVADGLVSVVSGGDVPSWMGNEAVGKTRALLSRNLNGIGRTDMRFGEDGPVAIIVERNARTGLRALDRADLDRAAREPDLSRSELGSIEGEITDTTTYHGRPAIRVRDRLTNADVVCVLPADLADRIGRQHDWQEVWTGSRVLISGEIRYRKDGLISRINVAELIQIKERPLDYRDIARPNLTGGLSPTAYLEKLWDDTDG